MSKMISFDNRTEEKYNVSRTSEYIVGHFSDVAQDLVRQAFDNGCSAPFLLMGVQLTLGQYEKYEKMYRRFQKEARS